MSRIGRTLVAPALLLAGLAVTHDASALPRGEVMARARAFAMHPWRAAAQNLTASCNPAYESIYSPGDYVGLPYDWGGYHTLFQFDQAVDDGLGVGSYPNDGVLACTVGLDCSGFVSQAWQIGHYTTSNLADVSGAISANAMLPGDVFNEAGYHVAMFVDSLSSGAPYMVEAINYNVHYNATGGWAHVDGFIPRKHQGITGSSGAEPLGTPFNPIVVNSFPYSDARNTAQSGSDILDGCGASPGVNESGREFVYEVTFDQPGQLTATVADDAGVDIDVHIYRSTNTSDCFARNDTTVTVNVDCGTYLVVADTFRGGSGESPGPYDLSLTFAPSGAQCGAGPEGYAPEGQLGSACGYPGDESLPFCNPNLGAEVCLYGDNDSFCSKPCANDGDCSALEGCCADIGGGELYCLTPDFCDGPPPGSTTASSSAAGDPVGVGGAGQGSGQGSGAGNGSGNGAGVGPSGAGGAAGTGGAASEGSSGDGDGDGSGSGDAADTDAEADSGCAAGGVPREGSAAWLVGLLGALLLRRRTPRSSGTSRSNS